MDDQRQKYIANLRKTLKHNKDCDYNDESGVYSVFNNGGLGLVVVDNGDYIWILDPLGKELNKDGHVDYKIIKRLDIIKSYPGLSKQCSTTKYSGVYDDPCENNTMLFLIGRNKYILIQDERLISFSTKEPIKLFYSCVGNNCVSYPCAWSYNYGYDLTEMEKIRKSKIEFRKPSDFYFINKFTYGVNKNDTKPIEYEVIYDKSQC